MELTGFSVSNMKHIPHGDAYLGNCRDSIPEIRFRCFIVSELKCCKICGAFLTCNHKGECCPECQYFDETDNICLAPESLKKAAKKSKPVQVVEEPEDDDTFLFEDDEEEEDEDLFDDEDEEDEDFDDDFDFDDDDW